MADAPARTYQGHCCDNVHLPFASKSELRRAAMATREAQRPGRKGDWQGWLRDDGKVSHELIIDIERIAVLFYQKPAGTRFFDADATSTPDFTAWGCVAWD